jgi:hypothetical protein
MWMIKKVEGGKQKGYVEWKKKAYDIEMLEIMEEAHEQN